MSRAHQGNRAVAVLGAGSWGTALAIVLAGRGFGVVLWGRDPARVAALASEHENRRYLPGVPLPESITASDDLAESVAGREAVVFAVPAAALAAVAAQVTPHLA